MTAIHVTDADFESMVVASDRPVVVDLWAPWCGPCRQISPALDEIAAEMGGRVTVAKVNVDENPGIATLLGVRSVPTLVVFRNGERVDQKVGAAPKGELARWIASHAA